jgi:hypothetical protein
MVSAAEDGERHAKTQALSIGREVELQLEFWFRRDLRSSTQMQKPLAIAVRPYRSAAPD